MRRRRRAAEGTYATVVSVVADGHTAAARLSSLPGRHEVPSEGEPVLVQGWQLPGGRADDHGMYEVGPDDVVTPLRPVVWIDGRGVRHLVDYLPTSVDDMEPVVLDEPPLHLRERPGP